MKNFLILCPLALLLTGGCGDSIEKLTMSGAGYIGRTGSCYSRGCDNPEIIDPSGNQLTNVHITQYKYTGADWGDDAVVDTLTLEGTDSLGRTVQIAGSSCD